MKDFVMRLLKIVNSISIWGYMILEEKNCIEMNKYLTTLMTYN